MGAPSSAPSKLSPRFNRSPWTRSFAWPTSEMANGASSSTRSTTPSRADQSSAESSLGQAWRVGRLDDVSHLLRLGRQSRSGRQLAPRKGALIGSFGLLHENRHHASALAGAAAVDPEVAARPAVDVHEAADWIKADARETERLGIRRHFRI